jgi:uncharacterized protein YggU (UPF0235/DUF167 family)
VSAGDRPNEIRFDVRLTPRAAFDRVDGVADGALRVRVSAPPVDEAANRALVRLLARELGVPASAVRIAAGPASRRKTVAVERVAREAILARWPDLRL